MTNNLVLVLGSLGFFVVLNSVCKLFLPKNGKFLQMAKDDPKKADLAYARHIACMVAAIHGFTATIVCTFVCMTKGITYGQPNHEIHNWTVSVS